ncbi:LOW QUALITY PROTEIN: hypothetical protein PHMEG_00022622 [Phytophthora megakarya]|uniref:Uncharacterized protein n=1 Tax=Phytophthora megakarya TaxID=4795 RepID=A0A225VKA3_9STRA|nr:LOW QUALITY PROTEIN: hypothetical protein PHMEG_00022622 [Phytophthora megakarya]
MIVFITSATLSRIAFNMASAPNKQYKALQFLLLFMHFFAAGGNTFPFDHPHIRMLLKGIRRFDPPRRRKSPVSIRLLETWFHSLDLKYPDAQALGGIVLGVLLPPSAIRDRGDLKIKF